MEASNDQTVQEGTQLSTNVDWQRGNTIGACMLEMYDRTLWTDVKIRCKDQEKEEAIKAHKIVLAARSPVFQAMFFGPCTDGKEEVELKDVEKEILLLFLRYIYSDTVELTEKNAFEVLEVAHLYQVSSLVQFCADYLATVITPNNACGMLEHAMLYELTGLKDVCCSFIDNQAMQVLSSENFLNVSPACLLYILKGDTFYANEEDILDMADKWSRKKLVENGQDVNGSNVRKCLGDSFYQLRLPTMTYKTLLESTSRKGYFSVEEYADIAGYINKVSGIVVSANSCIARVPEIETLKVNKEGKDPEITDSISVSLEISVAKDVALLNIVLGEIKPYLKNQEHFYTSYDFTKTKIEEDEKISKYKDEVVHFTCPGRYNLCKPRKYYVQVLKPVKQLELQTNLRLELSVSVVIKCIEFEKTFHIQQTLLENCKVALKPPLVLKKRKAPYVLDISIQYSYGGDVQIGAKGLQNVGYYYTESMGYSSEVSETISSKTNDTRVCCIKGSFAGIKSIGFKNFSNRETVSESEPTEVNFSDVRELQK